MKVYWFLIAINVKVEVWWKMYALFPFKIRASSTKQNNFDRSNQIIEQFYYRLKQFSLTSIIYIMFSRYVGLMEIADQNDDELLQGRTATTDQRQKKIKTHFVTCRLTNYFYYILPSSSKLDIPWKLLCSEAFATWWIRQFALLLTWCLSQIIVILQLLLALYLYTFYY